MRSSIAVSMRLTKKLATPAIEERQSLLHTRFQRPDINLRDLLIAFAGEQQA